MSDKKTPAAFVEERRINAQSLHVLATERRNKEKSEAKSYSAEDKRRVAREEHINGSRPKSSL